MVGLALELFEAFGGNVVAGQFFDPVIIGEVGTIVVFEGQLADLCVCVCEYKEMG